MASEPTIGDLLRAGARELIALIAKIVNEIKGLAPLVMMGCQGPTVQPMTQPAPGVSVSIAPSDAAESDQPKPLGQFTITFYYVIGEDEIAAKPANDNSEELASVARDPELVTLFETGCTPIADVDREFAHQLAIQGTGKLKDGRVLNIWGHCKCDHTPCFKVTQNQWGTAGTGHPLQPFRTVAVDPKVVKLGSLLYVPLLEGRTMPGRAPWGGYVHDGCVVADDTGGHIDGARIDLFVGRKAYFFGLTQAGYAGGSHAWAKHVPVFDGSQICERKGRVVARKSGAI